MQENELKELKKRILILENSNDIRGKLLLFHSDHLKHLDKFTEIQTIVNIIQSLIIIYLLFN